MPPSQPDSADDFPGGLSAGNAEAPSQLARPGFLHEVRMRAMATDFVVLLPPNAGDQLDAALNALHLVPGIEQRLSVYKADSDINRLNLAGGEWCKVHRDVWQVLQDAAVCSEKTDGAFDVTAGPLIDVWGFTMRSGRKPTPEQISAALAIVDWKDVQVDPVAASVRLGKPGMRVNLGAIGKGFALDQVTASLLDSGIEDFLIHGGHSTVVARGSSDPVENVEGGWLVGLQHPVHPKQRLGGIRLRDAAMSTSGPGKQFFHHRGKRYGHVIDPRTGWPAGDLESLTVVTASAGESDALATGWFVLGKDEAMRRADEANVPLYCVEATTRQAGVEVHLAGGAELA